jgi:CDP-glycerol glycerophosphotransferase (TagB/SpsB family)
MKLSIIWILSGNKEKNKKTQENLFRETAHITDEVQILVYGDRSLLPENTAGLPEQVSLEYREQVPTDAPALVYADALKCVKMPYVTAVNSGDSFRGGSFGRLDAAVKKFGAQYKIFMMNKLTPEGEKIPFSYRPDEDEFLPLPLAERIGCYPYFFGGTVLSAALWKQNGFCAESGIEAEREMLLLACTKEMKIVHVGSAYYQSGEAREGDEVFFEDVYNPDWYGRSLNDFWPAFLDRVESEEGGIPLFLQNHVMFTVANRINSNLNNKNKHVIPEGQEEDCLRAIGNLLKRIDDRAVFNVRKLGPNSEPDSVKWVFGILKYGEGYRFDLGFYNNILYYGAGSVLLGQVNNLRTNILFMDYRDERLEIDGTVHPILFSMAEEVFFQYENKKFPLEYNERYALTKVFGVSIYKSHSFHLSLPMKNPNGETLFCFAVVNGEKIKIKLNYESHFSRMSGRFRHSYWCFGEKRRFMAIKVKEGLVFRKVGRWQKFLRELELHFDMIREKEKRALLFILIRDAYFLARPVMKRHPIWMYLDKIYKGGDSSEYLYKYSCAQKDGIRHYYLVDKKASDYARLKKEGYRPLVRGSLKHRLVFLLSDMMVISNSTVFAFNNYGLVNSSYIRDLVDFHVCCVQHGMSVQKIAVAQNRLRDNTRLYFCASLYEFKNLSRPVYDYVGYHALKLTGVPRYDGLVDRHQKQIMISPTWRMQAAVPVRTSEGEQRDYNPLFKESTYYRVFNSLINDPRLLEAAKKYGYRIKYVLHPIVSAQVDDFDKNDYVDIVPAVGDMSYEQMFCESSLMVTDFSGIQFDFAYMRKPLVYLHHKDIPQHYEEGSFFYDTMAFGEICHDNDELIDVLCEYMENGCVMKEEYVRRADDFFYYDDHNNCERIYKEMRKYQDENIFHKPAVLDAELRPQENMEFDLKERAARKENLLAAAGENGIKPRPDGISDYYYDHPLNEKMILLLGLGKNVRGSMQYILNELNASPRFEGYQVFVRTDSETEVLVGQRIAENGWSRTKTVTGDALYREVMETAKYLITEVYFPEGWVKRPGQVYINIWHGTPLKKLGLAKNYRGRHKDGNTQRNFIEADYLLYPNDYTREHMLASYKVEGLMHGKTLMLGYPRTGGMLAAAQGDLSKLKAYLAPNGERIYAYMPTWKDYLEADEVVAEAAELLAYLDENLADDQILYVNLHHKVNASLDYSSFRRIRRFPQDVDTYELLAASDALITDYSSVFYDYLVLRRQIILYCADYEKYKEVRGTYMDISELPFDKALTKEEVLMALNRRKTYDDREAFKRFCAYDTTENASLLCSVLLGEDRVTDRVAPIEADKKRSVLIYDESCGDKQAVKLLDEFVTDYAIDGDSYYVGCDQDLVDQNKDTAYPLLYNTAVIGTSANPHFGSVSKSAVELYKQGKISYDERNGFLKYDYLLNAHRWFGSAKFDVVVIYDVTDADRLLTLLAVPAQRLLFLSDAVVEKLKSGDEFFRRTVCYAAGHCMGVFARNEKTKIEAELLLPRGVSVTLVENAMQLRQLLEELNRCAGGTVGKKGE